MAEIRSTGIMQSEESRLELLQIAAEHRRKPANSAEGTDFGRRPQVEDSPPTTRAAHSRT